MTRALTCVVAVFLAAACADVPPAAPAAPVLQTILDGGLQHPANWTSHEIVSCPPGAGQLQSIFPLDDAGSRVIVGRAPCGGLTLDSDDYRIYDLSGTTPVVLASVDIGGSGVRTAAHSPDGSGVGFGGRGDTLVIYDGAFRKVRVPCSGTCSGVTGVWAASPTDVWLTTGTQGVGAGRILHFDGVQFTVEYEGGNFWGIRGFTGATSQELYAVGDRILRRDASGTWAEVMGPADLPASCAPRPISLFHVTGISPSDIWVTGFPGCLLHYDGRRWTESARPANSAALGAIAALDARQIVLAGQGGVDVASGAIALWTSSDAGRTWQQVVDPLFQNLRSPRDGSFFGIVAVAGRTLLAPAIGGTLIVGAPGPAASLNTSAAAVTASLGSAEALGRSIVVLEKD